MLVSCLWTIWNATTYCRRARVRLLRWIQLFNRCWIVGRALVEMLFWQTSGIELIWVNVITYRWFLLVRQRLLFVSAFHRLLEYVCFSKRSWVISKDKVLFAEFWASLHDFFGFSLYELNQTVVSLWGAWMRWAWMRWARLKASTNSVLLAQTIFPAIRLWIIYKSIRVYTGRFPII